VDIKPHIQKIYNRVSNLIKTAYCTLPDNDQGDYSSAQVSYYGKVAYTQTIYPYGLQANAPTNTLYKLINNMGQEENTCAIPYCAKERFKGLQAGEVVIGSPLTGSYVKFLADGSIKILSKNKLNESITNDAIINIGGKTTLNSTDDISITTEGKVTLDSTDDVSVTTEGDINLTAADLNIDTPDCTSNAGDFSFHNLTLDSLTPSYSVVTDSHDKLISGGATATEISYLSGATSNIQDQIDAKISDTLLAGEFLVGNALDLATPVAMSNDATLSDTGALTISNNAITNAKAAQMAANTYKGNATSIPANADDISTNTAFNQSFETNAANIQPYGAASVGGLSTIARSDHVHPLSTFLRLVVDAVTVSTPGQTSFTGVLSQIPRARTVGTGLEVLGITVNGLCFMVYGSDFTLGGTNNQSITWLNSYALQTTDTMTISYYSAASTSTRPELIVDAVTVSTPGQTSFISALSQVPAITPLGVLEVLGVFVNGEIGRASCRERVSHIV
jgi:hypothetical protein